MSHPWQILAALFNGAVGYFVIGVCAWFMLTRDVIIKRDIDGYWLGPVRVNLGLLIMEKLIYATWLLMFLLVVTLLTYLWITHPELVRAPIHLHLEREGV